MTKMIWEEAVRLCKEAKDALDAGRTLILFRIPVTKKEYIAAKERGNTSLKKDWYKKRVHFSVPYKTPASVKNSILREYLAVDAYDTPKDGKHVYVGFGETDKEVPDRANSISKDVSAAINPEDRILYNALHMILPPEFTNERVHEENCKMILFSYAQSIAKTLPDYSNDQTMGRDCQTAIFEILKRISPTTKIILPKALHQDEIFAWNAKAFEEPESQEIGPVTSFWSSQQSNDGKRKISDDTKSTSRKRRRVGGIGLRGLGSESATQ